MPLINDELTVWEIAHRWAGCTPGWWRVPIPIAVRDYARVLMFGVLNSELECQTLLMEKWRPDNPLTPEFFIRHHLNEIEECIEGRRYSRRLLRWARISRIAFADWCERRSIPLPAFWFPDGWRIDYSWPSDDEDELSDEEEGLPLRGHVRSEPALRANQRARIACQQIATFIWRKNPDMTIAAMVEHESVQTLGTGDHYSPEVVRRWLSEVAPVHVKEKRGRPRKNNPTEQAAGGVAERDAHSDE